MDNQYIRDRALAVYDEASDVLDEASEGLSVPDLGEEDPFAPADIEKGDHQIVSPADGFVSNDDVDLSVSEDELDYTRYRGVSLSDPQADDTVGHDFADSVLTAKERLQQVEKLNQAMKEQGSSRRFVPTASDAPEQAYVYEEDGFEYYFKVDSTIRPSDVAEFNKDESWWLYDEDECVLKSILMLAEEHPEAISTASDVEQAYTFTDRTLKTEDEVVNDEDVFTLKQQDAIVATIVQAKADEDTQSYEKTRGEIQRDIEAVRRSIVIAKDDVKMAVPRRVVSNIETADKELGDALEMIRSGNMNGTEISLIQAREKLGTIRSALEQNNAPPGVVESVSQMETKVEEAKRKLRSL